MSSSLYRHFRKSSGARNSHGTHAKRTWVTLDVLSLAPLFFQIGFLFLLGRRRGVPRKVSNIRLSYFLLAWWWRWETRGCFFLIILRAYDARILVCRTSSLLRWNKASLIMGWSELRGLPYKFNATSSVRARSVLFIPSIELIALFATYNSVRFEWTWSPSRDVSWLFDKSSTWKMGSYTSIGIHSLQFKVRTLTLYDEFWPNWLFAGGVEENIYSF